MGWEANSYNFPVPCPLQLPKSWWSNYGEVLSETAAYVFGIGQQKGKNPFVWQYSPTHRTTNTAEVERIEIRKTVSSAILTKTFDNWLSLFQTFYIGNAFHSIGINKLVPNWQKGIDSLGSYFN